MPYYLNSASQDPVTVIAVTLTIIVVLGFIFWYRHENRRTPPLAEAREHTKLQADVAVDSGTQNIVVTGEVIRAVEALRSGYSYYHLAVKPDAPLSQVEEPYLCFCEDSGFVDLPLVRPGDRVELEISFDKDDEIQVHTFAWLSGEQKANQEQNG